MAGFKGGGGKGPGPQAPHQQGAPTKPYFIFGSIDTHNSCVYTTYESLTPRIFFHILMQAVCTMYSTIEYFTLF